VKLPISTSTAYHRAKRRIKNQTSDITAAARRASASSKSKINA
jgi:hypothetical protein